MNQFSLDARNVRLKSATLIRDARREADRPFCSCRSISTEVSARNEIAAQKKIDSPSQALTPTSTRAGLKSLKSPALHLFLWKRAPELTSFGSCSARVFFAQLGQVFGAV